MALVEHVLAIVNDRVSLKSAKDATLAFWAARPACKVNVFEGDALGNKIANKVSRSTISGVDLAISSVRYYMDLHPVLGHRDNTSKFLY